jgi:hypothetical protein
MTVSEAFATFKSELELPDRVQQQAATAQQQIREQISKYLFIPNSFLTGSYSRYTKIFPLNDIDVFLVRNERRTGLAAPGTGGVYPGRALDEVVEAVHKVYPAIASISKQNRSVNVQLQGLSFGFDLTPAWLRSPDGYWIPDADTGNWIPSDPDAHATRMTQANELNDGKLKPVIKMVKYWSRHNFDRLRSFHIELICADIFRTESITNFQIGVATFLVHLSPYVGRLMLDPVYNHTRVDKELPASELSELLLRIQSDAQRAVDALKLENGGYDNPAIEKWQEIFIYGFPK